MYEQNSASKNTAVPPQSQAKCDRIHGIEGKCMEMCSAKERLLREREGLLHKFECQEILQAPLQLQSLNLRSEVSSQPWPVEQSSNIGCSVSDYRSQNNKGRKQQIIKSVGRKPLPKADESKVIKSFARSAAGQDKTRPEDLRPAIVLKKTVVYLFTKILIRTDCPFNVIYDFVFDRLRAIRQDLVIQRIEDINAIIILETIVKFHIYSEFRLQDQPISIYDPHINQKHLVDCLRKLLTLYRVNNYWESSRADFEALNCLVFLTSYDVISKAVCLNINTKSKVLGTAICIALAYQSLNYVRFFRRIPELPSLLQMYCLKHVTTMRGFAYEVMCMAYGINSCKLPISAIASQLLYPSQLAVHRDLALITVEVIRDNANANLKYAKFVKSNFEILRTKISSVSNDINSPILEALRMDKSYASVSRLLCSWIQ